MPPLIQNTAEIIIIHDNDEAPHGRRPVRIGEPCPRCGTGILDYNGLLDLECPNCGFIESSGGGCT